ncbi:MAG: hypothetical protein M1484_04830 [Patescibacteria group bacterium]|nr:hypothetical protein [Patescibacteria group bacterium]
MTEKFERKIINAFAGQGTFVDEPAYVPTPFDSGRLVRARVTVKEYKIDAETRKLVGAAVNAVRSDGTKGNYECPLSSFAREDFRLEEEGGPLNPSVEALEKAWARYLAQGEPRNSWFSPGDLQIASRDMAKLLGLRAGRGYRAVLMGREERKNGEIGYKLWVYKGWGPWERNLKVVCSSGNFEEGEVEIVAQKSITSAA